jgi:hypothetical protein
MSGLRDLFIRTRGYVRLLARGVPPQSLILPSVQRLAPGLFSCGCLHGKELHGVSCGEIICSACSPASARAPVYTTRVSRLIVGSHHGAGVNNHQLSEA